MSIKLIRLPTGYPGEPDTTPDEPSSWKVYTVIDESFSNLPWARLDIEALTDDKDQEAARKTLRHFKNCARTGMDLSLMYDEKKCHPAHEYKRPIKNIEQKIWRLWGVGVIRIYFIYMPEKSIVVLKIDVKRVAKLTKGEKDALKDLAEKVLNSDASHNMCIEVLNEYKK